MASPHIIPWDDSRKREHQRGFQMPFLGPGNGAEALSVHVSVIKPGERAHPPHEHAGEEVMFLLAGTGEAMVGDHTEVIGANTAVYCPPHVMHGLRNCGEALIRYLVVRTP